MTCHRSVTRTTRRSRPRGSSGSAPTARVVRALARDLGFPDLAHRGSGRDLITVVIGTTIGMWPASTAVARDRPDARDRLVPRDPVLPLAIVLSVILEALDVDRDLRDRDHVVAEHLAHDPRPGAVGQDPDATWSVPGTGRGDWHLVTRHILPTSGRSSSRTRS